MKGEGDPRSPYREGLRVLLRQGCGPRWLLPLSPALVMPPTFLNTAGSGRGGPKKGTSSLAVTETWKERKLFLWGPGPTLLTASRNP